jgi:2'-5' RNA ligase
MTDIRAFIAVDLSAQARTILADLQDDLKAVVPRHTVRWTTPHNIHLTLHFLGTRSPQEIKKVSAVIDEATSNQPGFSLTLARLGCFPNLARPRILWVGILGDTNALTRLQGDLAERLRGAIDFTPDSRSYSPHLTIGRVKNGIPSRHVKQLSQIIQAEQPRVGHLITLDVTEISLMESNLKPSGAVYTQLTRSQLRSRL